MPNRLKPHTRRLLVAVVLAVLVAPTLAAAQELPELAPQPPSAGNGIFRVRVDPGGDLGSFAITTGPDHPQGDGLPVLSRSRRPGSSYTTIHSYDTGRDYTQAAGAAGNHLASHGTVTALGTTGFRTTYRLTGADQLRIIQDLDVQGTTLADTFVTLTTRVVNTGATVAHLGLRHTLDLQLLVPGAPNTNLVTGATLASQRTTRSTSAPTADLWEVEETALPLAVAGSVGPGADAAFPGAPDTTPADLLQIVDWPAARGAPFVAPVPDPPTALGDDSALLLFWGDAADHPLTVAPGDQMQVTTYLHHFASRFDPSGPPRGRPIRLCRRCRRRAPQATPPPTLESSTDSTVLGDPSGDAPYGGGDLVRAKVDYVRTGPGQPVVRLSARTRVPAWTANTWRFGETQLQWHLDTDDVVGGDHVALLTARLRAAGAVVNVGTTTFACNPTSTTDDRGWNTLTVPASCLGDPARVRAWVGLVFSPYPFIEDPPSGVDVVPETGWSPAVTLAPAP